MNEIMDVAPIRRVPTGIRGFEHISVGGLVEGRNTLLVGTSGSGKTLFATELLYRALTVFQRHAIFVTFEEKPADIVRNVQRLNWDLPTMVHDKKLIILDASLDRSVVEAGGYDLSGIISQITDAVKEIDAKLVVLGVIQVRDHLLQSESLERHADLEQRDDIGRLQVDHARSLPRDVFD